MPGMSGNEVGTFFRGAFYFIKRGLKLHCLAGSSNIILFHRAKKKLLNFRSPIKPELVLAARTHDIVRRLLLFCLPVLLLRLALLSVWLCRIIGMHIWSHSMNMALKVAIKEGN